MMAQFQTTGVVVVTGAAGGIGREVCLTFAENGAKGLLAVDLEGESATKVAEESKALSEFSEFKTLSLQVDVTSAASVQAMVDLAIREFGRIDYCINAAGVTVASLVPFVDTTEEDFDRVLNINAKGAFLVCKAVAKVMQEQKPTTVTLKRHGPRGLGRGCIVNIASAYCFIAASMKAPYTTSKHALLGITRACAMDCKAHGIRVNQVCPTWVRTPMFDYECERIPPVPKIIEKVVPTKRPAEPDEIASACLYLCSPSSVYVNGVALMMDSGISVGPSVI